MVHPPKNVCSSLIQWTGMTSQDNIMVPLDVIIMFRSSIFPVKRLIFMITNGANEKYEVFKGMLSWGNIFLGLKHGLPPKK